jgi:NADPH:quinone reductase-like Zn-dependent oxidoreductase
VKVAATGVGPWDALIREGKSKVAPQPPLTLGSDLSGVVEAVGLGVTEFKNSDQVYGVTNPQFCGANAEYAIAIASMIALQPLGITEIEAASVPVVAVTAWQMLFDYAHAEPGQTVMILGAAGNVGAYAVQFAARAGLHVVAVVTKKGTDYVRSLGAEIVLDSQIGTFKHSAPPVDVLIDTVGGETQELSLASLKPGGSGLRRLYRSATLSPGCAHSLLLCRRDYAAPEYHFKVVRKCRATTQSWQRSSFERSSNSARDACWRAA